MLKEVWRDIPGYEGCYQASNKGQIRSLPRNGTVKYKKILKPELVNGYQQVCLSINNVNKKEKVHRLVGRSFILNSKNKPCINHKDFNKTNNCIENLEWCTYRENTKHAINGKRICFFGENAPNAKLTDNNVEQIKHNYQKWKSIKRKHDKIYSQSAIAKKYKVSQASIWYILNNKTSCGVFGDKIRKHYKNGQKIIKKYKDFSQKNLAKKYNVSQVTISKRLCN